MIAKSSSLNHPSCPRALVPSCPRALVPLYPLERCRSSPAIFVTSLGSMMPATRTRGESWPTHRCRHRCRHGVDKCRSSSICPPHSRTPTAACPTASTPPRRRHRTPLFGSQCGRARAALAAARTRTITRRLWNCGYGIDSRYGSACTVKCCSNVTLTIILFSRPLPHLRPRPTTRLRWSSCIRSLVTSTGRPASRCSTWRH